MKTKQPRWRQLFRRLRHLLKSLKSRRRSRGVTSEPPDRSGDPSTPTNQQRAPLKITPSKQQVIVIDQIALALMEGAARALGTRLARGRGESVNIKHLVTEVADLKRQNGELIASIGGQEAALHALTAVVANVNGLAVDGNRVRFASEQGVGLDTSLYQLDEEIASLRRQVTPNGDDGSVADQKRLARHETEISVLDGIDEEIERARAGVTDDGLSQDRE